MARRRSSKQGGHRKRIEADPGRLLPTILAIFCITDQWGKLDDFQAEAQAGGGSLLRYSGNAFKSATIEVDSDNVPTKVSVENVAMKTTIELHFTPPQDPRPGDLRRLTFLDSSQQFGTSSNR